MIPLGRLSSTPIVDAFLTPLRYNSREDYEYGGANLQNITGRYLWKSLYDDTKLTIERSGMAPITILTLQGILHHSFAFDQNMNILVVYTTANGVYLYWYDPAVGGMTTSTLDSTIEYPQIALDDSRQLQSSASDVILTYIREDKLYSRVQRERYLQEHYLGEAVGIRLTQFGMTYNNRLRWRYVLK